MLVLTFFVAHELQRAIGYHLVGGHVGRSSCSALNEVDFELVVQPAVDDLPAGTLDSMQNLFTDCLHSKFARAAQLDHGKSADQIRIV